MSLAELPDVMVGIATRPQSTALDFYRELGSLFGVTLSPCNRWGGSKALRDRWLDHIERTGVRACRVPDENADRGRAPAGARGRGTGRALESGIQAPHLSSRFPSPLPATPGNTPEGKREKGPAGRSCGEGCGQVAGWETPASNSQGVFHAA